MLNENDMYDILAAIESQNRDNIAALCTLSMVREHLRRRAENNVFLMCEELSREEATDVTI